MRTILKKILSSLVNSMRQLQALLQFRHCTLRDNLLQPNASHQLFSLNKDLVDKCGEKEFKLELVRIF